MKEPDFRKAIVPAEYFERNLDFAKRVADAYDDAKEKNCSWYGPKVPFFISCPKLTDNGKTAQRVLRNKKGSL